MRGGKGVPETVAEHPLVFLTLTAPSFGPVHSRRVVDGKARRCRPRRDGEVCPHGVSLACVEVHDEDDPRLGEPICAECFDYEHAVLWNALAPELWRRTAIQLPRELARLLRRLADSGCGVRVSYVKVAEFQRRGALHFHCVLRLDGVSRGRRARAAAGRATARAADRRRARGRAARVGPLPRSDEPTGDCPASRPRRRARSAGARRSRCASSTRADRPRRRRRAPATSPSTRPSRTEAVGGLMYRLDAERRRATAGAAARAALRRVRVAARRLPAPARAAAAAVGARARLPRALLHQEPPLLDDVHRAAPGAPRARPRAAASGATRGAADERRRDVRAAALALRRDRLPDARRRVARRVRRKRALEQRRVAREELRTASGAARAATKGGSR